MKRQLAFITLSLASSTVAAHSLNIMLYHHIADDTPHSTSTKVADFVAQLDEFERLGLEVVDLEQAIHQIKTGQGSDKQAVALTFDDGFASVCDTAYPILKQRNLPFTVFVTTDPVDANYTGYCSWEQLKEMAESGVTIANHTLDHAFLVRDVETDPQWFDKATKNILAAQRRIEEQIGYAPKLFAYPYGEYNYQLRDWVSEQGYIAFGQQSGSIEAHSDWQALPRFNAAGHYASVSSLRFKLNARALPTKFSQLPDPVTLEDKPVLDVELLADNHGAHYPHLQCFFNGKPIEVEWHTSHRFSVVPPEALAEGRHRVNCTAPHRNGSPFYWLSQQWLVITD
ncbi:polysaccharide deacetylase family protein [Vibrio sp. WXL103]|uniref:polysaccharide deacetylase family protein n=1 Tax=Vibrio sp. WXL103 TaxID=3450710 RepID=UPI003EC943A6